MSTINSNPYIDSKYVINKNIFESIQDIAICSVCTGIVINPQQCAKCENLFCKSCIKLWNEKSFSCPYKCNEYILKEPSRVIKNILVRIIIKCPKNCGEELNYEDIIKHLEYCTSEIVDCPTCGNQISNVKINKIREKDLIVGLKIENENLKKRVEELESINLILNNNKTKNEKNEKYYKNKNVATPVTFTCHECLHKNKNVFDNICEYCGVNFNNNYGGEDYSGYKFNKKEFRDDLNNKDETKEKEIKLDVIKYKNFSKNKINKNNKISNNNLVVEEINNSGGNILMSSHNNTQYKRPISSKFNFAKKENKK